MVQVRDYRKVCRLAVSMCGFATPDRWPGGSEQFRNGVHTPLRAICCPEARREITSPEWPGIPPRQALNHAKSRHITVDHACFSRVGHRPFAGADQVNQGNQSGATGRLRQRNCPKGDRGNGHLISVNPASIFPLPEKNEPLYSDTPAHLRSITFSASYRPVVLNPNCAGLRSIAADCGRLRRFFVRSPAETLPANASETRSICHGFDHHAPQPPNPEMEQEKAEPNESGKSEPPFPPFPPFPPVQKGGLPLLPKSHSTVCSHPRAVVNGTSLC